MEGFALTRFIIVRKACDQIYTNLKIRKDFPEIPNSSFLTPN